MRYWQMLSPQWSVVNTNANGTHISCPIAKRGSSSCDMEKYSHEGSKAGGVERKHGSKWSTSCLRTGNDRYSGNLLWL